MKAFHFFVLAAFAAPGFAQDAPAPQVDGVDEVIVPGRTTQELRLEIERLESAVHERFNALNSSDELDIFCSEQAPTGSNIPVRTCRPNFVIRAEQRAAGRSLNRMQGGAYGIPQYERARLEKKNEELVAEMQRIAREDEQFLRELTRLAELKGVAGSGEPLSTPASE
jgi:hypothetical protein